jgi:hypothetical protein
MKKTLLLLFAFLTIAGCEDRVIGPERTDQDAILVAYFAQLMAEEPFPAGVAYCVSTGTWANRQDPTEEVIADLRRLYGKVQPGSGCLSTQTATTYNGEPARSYHVESAVVQGNVATAVGFYRQNASDGAYYTGHLEKQGALWVVTSFEQTGVW